MEKSTLYILPLDKKNCKKHIKEWKKGKAEMEKMISDEPAVFAKFAAERAAEEKKIQPLIDECKNKVEAIQAEMKGYIDKFEAVYKATAEQFGNLVDERDWENVDLIIFNYETGRALDMRDALVQVDHERRNERLIEAVEYASSAISRSIDRGFGSLQSIMDRKFTMLGKSISHFTSEVSGLASQSVAQSKMIEGKLGELVESSHIQQALISQMDKSSSEIAENVEDMLRYTYYDI